MAVYLITYDLKSASSYDYSELHTKIKTFGDWYHILESTWLVDTNKSASTMSDEIRSVYQPEKHFISQVIKGGYQGWLNKDVWTWLGDRL